MTLLSLPTAEFGSCAQWKNRVLTQFLWKLDRVYHEDAFSPLEIRPGTSWRIEQLTSQQGTQMWTFQVSWPGHEFEVCAKELDR